MYIYQFGREGQPIDAISKISSATTICLVDHENICKIIVLLTRCFTDKQCMLWRLRPTDTKIIDGSVDKVTTWLQATTTINALVFVFENSIDNHRCGVVFGKHDRFD